MAAERDHVLYESSGNVATITFNRPEHMNTLTPEMGDLLVKYLLRAEDDPNVRVVVLTGAGRAFCAGLDLKAQAAGDGLFDGPRGVRHELDLGKISPTVLHRMNTPVIAALNGSAAGAGLDAALNCDIRIAARSAKLALSFTKRAIVPEAGTSWVLPRLVGRSLAAELIFTGRTITAEQAADMRIVSRVVDDDALADEVAALAAEIAANAPLAVRAAKQLLRAGENETYEDHVHHVFLQLLPLTLTDDFKEALSAFIEKRTPDFQGH